MVFYSFFSFVYDELLVNYSLTVGRGAKERYKTEAKNSEIKHRHGYDVATSSGLIGMQLQGALTMFAVNIKTERAKALYEEDQIIGVLLP